MNYESLHDGEPGKTEVSWLSTYKNILGTKLHREHNALEDITDAEQAAEGQPERDRVQSQLKRLDRLIGTAGMLHESARYLQWFTNRIVEINDAKKEYEKDFTLDLVAGWIKTEVGKVKDHEQNCFVSSLKLLRSSISKCSFFRTSKPSWRASCSPKLRNPPAIGLLNFPLITQSCHKQLVPFCHLNHFHVTNS